MAAGIATLRRLKRERSQIYSRLDNDSARLVDGIGQAARENGVDTTSNRVGSMFTWFFQRNEVHNWDQAAKSDTGKFAEFHRGMLEGGIYLPPSQFEAAFLSTTHSTEDIERTIHTAQQVFRSARESSVAQR
jgi:glutamate-1-semialdehyde 2,1-aminomutase